MRLSITRSTKRTPSRSGLSLLEVILSLAILGLSLVAIGHLFNLGFRSAADMQLRSQANMIADTTMAEVAAGVIDFSASGGIVEDNPLWKYQVVSQDSTQPGLMSVTVTVSLADTANDSVSVSLVRLVADPDFEPEQEMAVSRQGVGQSSSGSSGGSFSSGGLGSGTR